MILLPEQPWWQKGVIYQIYPRSFLDTTGNGIGDLRGIIKKLDYLEELGVSGLWLCPIFPSPMYDFGYDTSDYYNIEPLFGSMDLFQEMLLTARKKNIRIILDLALNHTSHLHPWFIESSSSRNNTRSDWYIWANPRPPRRPPNNWKSVFGGSAWTWSEKRKQYYLHSFTPEQPDLNWRNPDVKKELYNIIRFWLEKGADGFRLDVVDFFLKDDRLRSNPLCIGRRPYEMQKHIYDKNRPETIEIMREIRSLVDLYPHKLALGEVAERNTEIAASYYGPASDGLHLNFNFDFLEQPWKAKAFQVSIEDWEKLLGTGNWPVYTLSNHDVPRHFSRYGNCQNRARAAAGMVLTLKGTPVIYYGEELGMPQGRIPRAQIRDPVGKRYWPFHPGRDGSRTPMQWDDSPNAGFTDANPWLPVNPNFPRVNVADQKKDPQSLYHFYRRLIKFRNSSNALQSGIIRFTNPSNSSVLAYQRKVPGENLLILINFSSRDQPVELPSKFVSPHLAFSCPTLEIEAGKKRVLLPPDGFAILQE